MALTSRPEAPGPSISRVITGHYVVCQPQPGVEDAIIFLLHMVYTHMEEVGSYVRVMFFFPFSCASSCNTIRPALLRAKLLDIMVDAPLKVYLDPSA